MVLDFIQHKRNVLSLLALVSIFSFFSTATPVLADQATSTRAFHHSKADLSQIYATPPFHLRTRRSKFNTNDIVTNALTPQGLSPTQIRTVYGLPSSGGTGTIALVEAYDNPNAESDLATFDSQFSLPACTTANTCFQKYEMASSTGSDSSWTIESSLDVQWAHAIAPNAKILLVEAKSSDLQDLLAAVDYARNRSDVAAVSISWGSSEFSGENSYDSHFVSPYGAQFFAASGDTGAGVQWPAASINVVSVGGTTLSFASSTLSSETAWSGSGGGVSAYESEPGFQSTYGILNSSGYRAVPDVSYNADPASGVSVYDSSSYEGQSGWFIVGGTSAGAPQWAAIHALRHTASAAILYAAASSTPKYAADFRDIISGTNGTCGAYCTAGVGYDYVTGLGSPLTDDFSLPSTYASVTPALGGGEVSIDTTSYTGGTGAWSTLTGPNVAETSAGQISAGMHTFTLPTGWQFNTAHAATLTLIGTTSLSVATTTLTPSATSFSFTVGTTSSSTGAAINISGLQVRPTGTTTPSFGIMTHAGAAIAGVASSTSFGSFSALAGQPVSVDIETQSDGSGIIVPAESLQSGTSTQMYAVSRDRFGNFATDASSTWSLIDKTGGATSTDLVPSADGTSATFTAHLIGSAEIQALASGFATTTSGIITVTIGTTTSLMLSPANATTTAGTAVTYTAQGTDAAGNTADVTASTTFSIDSGAGSAFSGNTDTPTNAGTWIVSGLQDGVTGTTSLQVSAAVTPVQTFSGGGGGGGGGGGWGGTTNTSLNTTTKTTSVTTTKIASTTTASIVTAASTSPSVVALPTIATPSVPTYSFTRDLGIGMSGEDVLELQEFLNVHGFLVASTGIGSPGNETDSFGEKTKLALAEFQAANDISPASGYFGPLTRGVINALSAGTTEPTASASSITPTAPSSISADTTYTRSLSVGSSGDDVLALQQFLITQKTGPAAEALASAGASGTFGPLTKAALAEYQASVGIVPAMGYFGSVTRAYVEAHS